MADARVLLEPWPGPYGGVPPFDRANPAAIEEATHIAVAQKRREIDAIADNPEAPTFQNTIEALEDCGRALQRVNVVRHVFASTHALGDMPAVQQRLAPLIEQLEDDIAQNQRLFARIEAVRATAGLTPLQQRLTDVIHERFARRGAGLPQNKSARLKEINARLATLSATFNQNLLEGDKGEAVFVQNEQALAGLPAEAIEAAAQTARALGKPDQWAIANTRPSVWPVFTSAHDRDLRHRVWAMWFGRGAKSGALDNRPVIAEILKLRGEKARLLGYPSFAHYACAARMAATPENAMAQMLAAWTPVLARTQAQLADLQRLADADGIGAVQAWDRLYYAERLRQQRFGLDANAVRPYLTVDNVLNAIFDAAGKLHGLSFRAVDDVPKIDPAIRTIEVSRDGAPIGVVWFDLMRRDGKARGSWQFEYRGHESFREPHAVVLSGVCSNLEPAAAGGPVLMGWEYANVLFHEFGHAMHMLMGRAPYPSLGSMAVAWDMIETPSQLNERWLYDRALIAKHLRHVETGEPLPDAMIDAIEAAAKYDRVFSVGLEYLGTAIVDMRAHLAADGGAVDIMAIEQDVRRDLGMPEAVDLVMRPPHLFHAFSGEHYAAGVYVYLWADVMVADVIEAFEAAPGGLYDAETAQRWRDSFLSIGASVPGQAAFRAFRGRDPDPMALMRRFDLVDAA